MAPGVQPGLRRDAVDALAIRHAVDHLDQRGRLAAAADGDVLECRVGGDDEIRAGVAHALEEQERPIEQALGAELDDEQFRRDVVLIEDEPLAHELEQQSGEKDDVGRIAGLDDRKAAFAMNLDQEPELMEQRG